MKLAVALLSLLSLADAAPLISESLPFADEVITSSSFNFLANVQDVDDLGIQSVEFQFKDQFDNELEYQQAVGEDLSGLYHLLYNDLEDGDWDYRVKAVTYAPAESDEDPEVVRHHGRSLQQGGALETVTEWVPFTVEVESESVPSMETAREEIQALLQDTPDLAHKFVRLAMHDCVGGCDGCVDVGNTDNAELEEIIDVLASVVQNNVVDEGTNSMPGPGDSSSSNGGMDSEPKLSRADVWVLAALEGAKAGQTVGEMDMVDFPMEWIGRRDCETSDDECLDAEGNIVECSAKKGPHRDMPDTDSHTYDLLTWFQQEFGFEYEEVIALMGGNFWARNGGVLDNHFYGHLVGGESMNEEDQVFYEDAPCWKQAETLEWEACGSNLSEDKLLNVDVALVRNFEGYLDQNVRGKVLCQFIEQTGDATIVCPVSDHMYFMIVGEYKSDNSYWLNDFQDVLSQMFLTGYDAGGACTDECLPLSPA